MYGYSPRRRQRTLTAFLFLAASALAVANWHILNIKIDRSHASPETGSRETSPIAFNPAEQLVATSLDAYPETTARPLFSATRRPPPTVAPEPAPELVPETPDNLRLVGIMENGSGGIQALIRTGEAPGTWLATGDRIADWSLARIEDDQVILRNGRHTFTLTLFPNRDAKE